MASLHYDHEAVGRYRGHVWALSKGNFTVEKACVDYWGGRDIFVWKGDIPVAK